jgi:2-polyprenyl-6-methoxyphenol hydroxylase-like FAD-dependent oxidoreductase
VAGPKRILIIGGGIGGLGAAVALRRRGFEADVFEQAEELREIGAGLSVWPNATWVLREFGLLPQALERGSRLERLVLQTWQGKLLVETSAPRREATPSICIHRGDLLGLLRDALPSEAISLGRRFQNMEERHGKIAARFADGHWETADALAGADGLYSAVREKVLGAAKPVYRGHHAWRGIADFRLPKEFAATACESWGAGSRFGFEPMGEGRTFWYATKNAPEGTLGEPGGWKNEVVREFRGWAAPISAIVEATAERAVLKHEIFDREPVRETGKGRATLLGDAANPTTPNLGQGACMALEDAFVLSECLEGKEDVPQALRDYESRRYARRKFITLESRRIGRIAQLESGAAVVIRNSLLRITPAFITNFQHRRYHAFPS